MRTKSDETKFEKLVLTGSSTVAPLAAEIGKRFESLHSNVRVDVQTGGSSRGVSDARAGLADIGMASRALKDDEKDLLQFTIALDGISVIVNKANPVETLNKQQIIDIYTGKIVVSTDADVVGDTVFHAGRRITSHAFGYRIGAVQPLLCAKLCRRWLSSSHRIIWQAFHPWFTGFGG